jgi:hypothetical protein
MTLEEKLAKVLTLCGVQVKFKSWGASDPVTGKFDIIEHTWTLKNAYILKDMVLINFEEFPNYFMNCDVIKVPMGKEFIDIASYLIAVDPEDI